MAKNLALFLDCDRLEVAFMTVIFDYLQSEGYNVCMKKAYITKENLDTWYNQLEKNYFRLVLGSGQANINMKISVDVSAALYSGNYDSIAIASNYREFGILAHTIRAKGLEAVCFYQYSKGNELFLKRAYNTIYNLEPRQVHHQTSAQDFDPTKDMLDVFESALEGLDSKMLEQTLSADDSKQTKVATKATPKTRTKKTTNKKNI